MPHYEFSQILNQSLVHYRPLKIDIYFIKNLFLENGQEQWMQFTKNVAHKFRMKPKHDDTKKKLIFEY